MKFGESYPNPAKHFLENFQTPISRPRIGVGVGRWDFVCRCHLLRTIQNCQKIFLHSCISVCQQKINKNHCNQYRNFLAIKASSSLWQKLMYSCTSAGQRNYCTLLLSNLKRKEIKDSYYITEDSPLCSTGLRPLRSRCPAHIEIHKNQYIYTHVHQQGKGTTVHYRFQI